jgi:hypothetical protein
MSEPTKSGSKKTIYIAVAVIAVIAVVVTACFVGGLFNSSGTPKATPTPTATPTHTASPTATPTATPSPTPTPTPTPAYNVTIAETDYNATMGTGQNTTYTATVKITDHTFNQLVTMMLSEQNLNVTASNGTAITGNLTTVLPAMIPQITNEFGFYGNFTVSDASSGQFTITFVSENATTISGGIPTNLFAQNLQLQLNKIVNTIM